MTQCEDSLMRAQAPPSDDLDPLGLPPFPTTSAASHLWVASLSNTTTPSNHHPHTCAHMQGLGSEGLGGAGPW